MRWLLRWLGPASLEGRLVLRLGALMAAALIAGMIQLARSGHEAARELGNERLTDGFVRAFLHDVFWTFPAGGLALLVVGAWTIRTSLRSVRTASDQAAAITPGASGVRLPLDGLPSEVRPLVSATNAALERLEQGFEVQRQFTADAAHELRTPLAILTAGLEALPPSPEVARLRLDAERMNRLVGQLLRVARLDAQPVDLCGVVDLGEVAAGVVGRLAPWAAQSGAKLAFEPAHAPTLVRGDADALGDAIRNLVENAVAHGPRGEEVVVRVDAEGAVSVLDKGPGVPAELRDRIFERFWRSRERRSSGVGAGLGLSIVAETARAHAGQVEVADTPGGGACFVLSLPLAAS